MKRRGGFSPSTLEGIRSAQDRKKALTARLLEKRPASQPPQKDSGEKDALPAPEPHATPEMPAVTIGLRLRADDAEVEIQPIRAIEQLAGTMLSVAAGQVPRSVLLWPGSIRSIGLAHAVATAARWQEGNKRGLRTLVYPAKSNFLKSLNHAHVDKRDLVKLAQDLYEEIGKPNDKVVVSLREKDAFWLALNNLSDDPAGRVHPSLAELLPHFFARTEFDGWKACDGDLFRHIKSYLKTRGDKRALGQFTIARLAEPAGAPDAIFAVSWIATKSDIRNALRELKDAGRPDILVIDLTRGLRKDNPNWKANAIAFLELFHKTFAEDTPPPLIVVDEPHVRSHFIKELSKSAIKKGDAAKWLLESALPVEGIVCTAGRDGLTRAGARQEDPPLAKDIHVAITDTEASVVVALLGRVREGLEEPDWLQAIENAERYLSTLAALPSSTRMLIQWLDEADVPMGVRKNYAWPVFRATLEEVLHDPSFRKRGLLQQAIDQGSALWENYENGTPMARKLADLIEEHTRGSERCCIVFTRPTARRLAERYFETYDGYPEGAGYEVLKDCVRFVVSRDLEMGIERRPNETVVFAGLDEVSLRSLLVDQDISSPSYVFLTRRNAAYLRATLRAVKAIPGFDPLRTRLECVLNQLPDFPSADERTSLSRSDFVLPTFSFEHGLSSYLAHEDEHDEAAWEMLLDSGTRIRRNPASAIYVYDPALSHTPTRGFRSAIVGNLGEGDHVFVMSTELRELTESALKEAGVPISNDRHFESTLRQYHERIGELAQAVPGTSLTEKARNLKEILEIHLEANGQMPADGTLRNWLDVDRFRDVSFENAKPGAPRSEPHFKAFAKAIGLPEHEAIGFWRMVIQPLRGVRRADGRRVADAYADLLLDPESAVVHKRMPHGAVQSLFARAKENVHVIEVIRKPEGGGIDG